LTATITQYHEARNIAILEMRKRFLANISAAQNVTDDLQPTKPTVAKKLKLLPDNNALCPEESPLLQGNNHIHFEGQTTDTYNWPPTYEDIAVAFPKLRIGGYYPGPDNCKARHSTAIIIPVRDREEHLRFLLYYLHSMLQRQQLRYQIVVVEQDDRNIFNKDQLMNTAFKYIVNNTNFRCVVFHDVDLFSENDRLIYKCTESDDTVTHLAHRIDKYEYKFCCGMTIGGVLMLKTDQFIKINGFSNEYYGWGGEDDDANQRIIWTGRFNIYRPPEPFARYRMIKHPHDEANPISPKRYELLQNWGNRQPHDGLNSLNTTITKVIKNRTHLRLMVRPKPQPEQTT